VAATKGEHHRIDLVCEGGVKEFRSGKKHSRRAKLAELFREKETAGV
jgi:hypothetical protein